jgi:hypothetical protein
MIFREIKKSRKVMKEIIIISKINSRINNYRLLINNNRIRCVVKQHREEWLVNKINKINFNKRIF